MKRKFAFTALALAAVFVLEAKLATAHAQSYSINWFTIDGVGGTSTGGFYAVRRW